MYSIEYWVLQRLYDLEDSSEEEISGIGKVNSKQENGLIIDISWVDFHELDSSSPFLSPPNPISF